MADDENAAAEAEIEAGQDYLAAPEDEEEEESLPPLEAELTEPPSIPEDAGPEPPPEEVVAAELEPEPEEVEAPPLPAAARLRSKSISIEAQVPGVPEESESAPEGPQEVENAQEAEDAPLPAEPEPLPVESPSEDEEEMIPVKRKSESVKFSEPTILGEGKDFDREFDDLMDADGTNFMDVFGLLGDALMAEEGGFAPTENVDDYGEGESDELPELEDEYYEDEEDEDEGFDEDMNECEMELDGEDEADFEYGGRKSTFGHGSFEITPEYIFNELKVAETMKDDAGQNIQSFIISKSFSSENVVVLLNLRRMNDGEWALDKTIAQGLKQETYGGVVSIDQYEFTDQPGPGEEKSKPSSKRASAEEPEPPTELSGNIMEILKKLEDHVADVNKDILVARKLLREMPPCRPCEEGENNEGAGENDGTDTCAALAFDDMTFFEKLKKLLEITLNGNEDPCECCQPMEDAEGLSTYNAVSLWLRSVMNDMKEYSPFSFFIPGAPACGSMDASEAAALISQDAELLEQARKSGLLDALISDSMEEEADEDAEEDTEETINTDMSEEDDNAENDEEEEKLPPFEGVDDTVELQAEAEAVDADKVEEDEPLEMTVAFENVVPIPSTVTGSLQLNIESKVELEDFIREHQAEGAVAEAKPEETLPEEVKPEASVEKVEELKPPNVENAVTPEDSVAEKTESAGGPNVENADDTMQEDTEAQEEDVA